MNQFGINLHQLEAQAQRAAIFELAVSIALLIGLFWATYWVIKAGVRDGIKEASPASRPHQNAPAPAGYKWALVKETAHTSDMRAD